jgi:UDP-N-acetylmuramate--alanine ligase
VLCLDHPHVQAILPRIHRRHVTYGLSSQADYHARGVRHEGLLMHFQGFRRSEPLGEFSLRMPGLHNVQNALAVIAIADELGVPLQVTKDALATFSGVARRFTIVGEVNGVTLVDDYGHHPAEIEATLAAAQAAYDRRVVVAFQPHRYTRTRDLFHEFTRAFNQADVLLITDVYGAGEQPIEGASSEALARAIRHHGHHNVRHVPDKTRVVDALQEIVQPGDVVIALGAGDINQSVRELHQRWGGGKPVS